jgi:hypothetical protein
MRYAGALRDAMASGNGREIGEQRRRERLAASLRENLKKRKNQQRGRAIVSGAAGSASGDVQALKESAPTFGEREV